MRSSSTARLWQRVVPLSLCVLWVIFAAGSTAPRLFAGGAIVPAGPEPSKPDDHYAIIVGTVWGPDDLPVYGVKVKIRRAADKKPKWELYSDHRGEFAQRVPAGGYVVWADLKGVKPADGKPLHLVQEVPVQIGPDERMNIGLHLAR
jgi:hypothetical protein